MTTFSPNLRRTARRQHGIVSGHQMRTDGITEESIEHLRMRRLIEPVHRDLYRAASAPDSLESRCVAASLAHDHVAVGGASAAALWDFDLVYRPSHPECLFLAARPVVRPLRGVNYRAVRRLDADDIVERGDAIRVTSRARTWIDCVTPMSDAHAVRFTEHVLDSQCDLDELWSTVDGREAARRGTPGRAYQTLSSRRGWNRPATRSAA